MDPCLENPGLWPDVHHTLISGSRDLLTVQLRPKYVVRVEERVYEEVHEAFLKVIDRESREVVTVIEILSPTNKVPGSAGRDSFEEKRREVMRSPSHVVEIDLLRGERMVPIPKKIGPHEYLVHVSKKGLRPRGLLYPIRLPRRLPVIPIPLKAGDPDVRLDLQAVLEASYDRAGYDLEIDYRKEPQPPLDAELATWADQLLRSKGLR
jgi:hypothetical protein